MSSLAPERVSPARTSHLPSGLPSEKNRERDALVKRNDAVPVTYYTVATRPYFLGAVTLINSLRLTGNEGDVVVLDAGLSSDQRNVLAPAARIVPVDGAFEHPVLMKTYAGELDPSGVVVVLDSDVIVTGSLGEYFTLARDGKICAYPDRNDVRLRWFPEWEQTLRLRAPLRRDTYVNSGFVVFDADHWPTLLGRWAEVCRLIPAEAMFAARSPFNAPDQDALNALLMSEFPQGAVGLLPEEDWAFGGNAKLDDLDTLQCSAHGEPKLMLHYLGHPKPWQSRGWLRLAGMDYMVLMKRLLFADDVPLRIRPNQVPLWLRPTRGGGTVLHGLGAANSVIVGAAHRLPERFREPLRRIRQSVSGPFVFDWLGASATFLSTLCA
jgi:hypothetical protein